METESNVALSLGEILKCDCVGCFEKKQQFGIKVDDLFSLES